MKNASGPGFQDDRAALEGLLGRAEQLDADLLRWTATRTPGGDAARLGRPYDPDSHEAVYYHHDPASGLRALVALHSTVLGPGFGGARWRAYENIGEALIDVLRLSAAMTAKSAVAGLDYGGGKAAIVGDGAAKTPGQLAAFGRFVERLGGRYVTTTDVGTTLGDLQQIARETAHIAGVARGREHDVDTSEPTARTVVNGMHAACEFAFGDGSLEGRRVVRRGHGQGRRQGGAPRRRRGRQCRRRRPLRGRRRAPWRSEIGGEVIALEGAYLQPCDVLSPNALGGVLNPLASPVDPAAALPRGLRSGEQPAAARSGGDAELLAARGILYAPDYVVNCGGVVAAGVDHAGRGAARVEELLERVAPDDAGAAAPRRARGRLDGRGGAAQRRRAARAGAGGLRAPRRAALGGYEQPTFVYAASASDHTEGAEHLRNRRTRWTGDSRARRH